MSRGHPRWKWSGDTAGRSLCVRARHGAMFWKRVVIEGGMEGMEGTRVTNDRGGRAAGTAMEERADRRCSDTRRLEEPHIFSVVPWGTEICESTRVRGYRKTHERSLSFSHTHTPTHARSRVKTCTH